MQEFTNPARARMEAGDLTLGVGIKMSRTVEVAPMMKTAGYDWLFIDLEHGSMSLDDASQLCVMGLASGISPIVRVPKGEYAMATRVLDNGATGIVVPHVDTPEEAAEVVERVKYPPLGHRSVAGTMPHFNFEPMRIGDSSRILNKAVLTVVMIESPEAVENAGRIAEVPGIDVVMVGSNDLCSELGIPGEFGHEKFEAALRKVAADVLAAEKWPGVAGLYDETLLARYLDATGIRWILAGTDTAFTLSAARDRSAAIRSAGAA